MQDAKRAAVVMECKTKMRSSELNEEQEQGYVDALRFAKALSEGCAKNSIFRKTVGTELLYLPNDARYGKYFGKKTNKTN